MPRVSFRVRTVDGQWLLQYKAARHRRVKPLVFTILAAVIDATYAREDPRVGIVQ
jgi:hypothetical protein